MKTALVLASFFIAGSIFSTFTSIESDDNNRSPAPLLSQKVELGKVEWQPDIEQAKLVAKANKKPMFVLILENPDGRTAQDFGKQVLSFPLVVEAIEQFFVPVAIQSSKEKNSDLANKFGAPANNKPIVRFLDSDETEMIERRNEILTIDSTITQIATAIKKSGKAVPNYLKFARNASNDKTEVAEFAMHCYWEGEAKLGSIDGVHSTRSGWRNGLEVVQLIYSPAIVDYRTLLNAAEKFDCAAKIFTHTKQQFEIAKLVAMNKAEMADGPMRDAKSSDQKYYLSRTIYKHLPLTEIQATKINALAKQRHSAKSLLSPRQIELLSGIQRMLKSNKNSLEKFIYPNDRHSLAAYHQKLLDHLRDSDEF